MNAANEAGIGGSNAEAFRAFAWRFVDTSDQAMVALGQRPIDDIRRYADVEPLLRSYARTALTNARVEGWEAQVAQIQRDLNPRNMPQWAKSRSEDIVALVMYLRTRPIEDPVLDGLRSAVEYDKTYFEKILSSVPARRSSATEG
jgi:hypothetical protein